MKMRLNKFLSESGICSRRKADEYILSGDVTINGQKAVELGMKIDPETDIITFQGKEIKPSDDLVYYALYKPKGVVSSAQDELGRKTVLDLVPSMPRVYPVGRLDEASEGLIILTNDGEITQQLTHPSFEHEKEYKIITRNGKWDIEKDIDAIRQRFLRGMEIDSKLMKVDKISITSPNKSSLLITTVIHTGFNRQLRKMCAKIGLEVKKLTRIRIAKLRLADLGIASGQYKKISKNGIL